MKTPSCKKKQKEGRGQDVGGGICLLSRSEQLPSEFLYLRLEIFCFLLDINFMSPPFLSVMGTLTPAILLLLKCFRLRNRRNKVVWTLQRQEVPSKGNLAFFLFSESRVWALLCGLCVLTLAPLGLWVTPQFLVASGRVRLETPASSIPSVEGGWDQEATGEFRGRRNVVSCGSKGPVLSWVYRTAVGRFWILLCVPMGEEGEILQVRGPD